MTPLKPRGSSYLNFPGPKFASNRAPLLTAPAAVETGATAQAHRGGRTGALWVTAAGARLEGRLEWLWRNRGAVWRGMAQGGAR